MFDAGANVQGMFNDFLMFYMVEVDFKNKRRKKLLRLLPSDATEK